MSNPISTLAGDADIPFRGIIEQSLAGVYVIQDEVFQYVNATFAEMIGYTPAELIGTLLRDTAAPESIDEVLARIEQRISGAVASLRFVTRCTRVARASISKCTARGSSIAAVPRLPGSPSM
jgi:PAS domain S-box-containing protein